MKSKPDLLLTLFFAIIFLGAVLSSITWPFRASVGVFAVAGTGFILSVVHLWKEPRAKSQAQDTSIDSTVDVPVDSESDTSKVRRHTFHAWGWILGLLLVIWLIGFHVALPLFVFVYSKINGARWLLSLGLAALVFGMIYGVFTKMIGITWLDPYLLQLIRG